jgi:hypothetical protein
MGKVLQFPITLNPIEVVSLTERHREEWKEQDRKLEELLNSDLSDDEVIERAQKLFR